jgi:hypothetical protein
LAHQIAEKRITKIFDISISLVLLIDRNSFSCSLFLPVPQNWLKGLPVLRRNLTSKFRQVTPFHPTLDRRILKQIPNLLWLFLAQAVHSSDGMENSVLIHG